MEFKDVCDRDVVSWSDIEDQLPTLLFIQTLDAETLDSIFD